MNNLNHKPFCLEVWGDYACFTRPEMKVERVSYDVPTPSAVRAVFEAIFWKPAIRWHPTKIEIINPIKWTSVRRNEVGAIASDRSSGIIIEDNRQQRACYFLKDVKYRFYAVLEYIPISERKNNNHKAITDFLMEPEERELYLEEFKLWQEQKDLYRKDETPGKYLAIFERRASKGQCFNQPYLGTREFSCNFKLIKDFETNPAKTIDETRELGFMLYDMDFTDLEDPKPMFFKAKIENGVVKIPPITSEEIRR
ncbi:MAG: type I-C CRISPR-associated protein Cas5c [Ignavibacterium album]|uniref:type I-C CRISPR-associated protein Cas5c n=1 Tax=Ignavibacterium album TaxID=591197 RepID=UPI0026EA245F|nr:type I-C CRISPR-associated protein Cas5c [Ignavibacterium album]MCX8105781.1 type I-C CRISPR-associated protein Cas5c [Ignavibacterium album]